MNFEYSWYFLIAFLFGFYSYIHAVLLKGLKNLSQPTTPELHPISVLVAARNEEKNIERCILSLVHQNYPKDSYEIIVINDRSVDATEEIINDIVKKYPIVKLLSIKELSSNLPPKKNALNEGIKKSKHDILAFTDADSFVPPQWLREVSKAFTSNVGVVAGYSPFEEKFSLTTKIDWGDLFLRYEELKNSLGAAAGIALGNAYMCTGRNFAYRKSIFERVGGYEKIKHSISGDDDLFIQLVQKKIGCGMRYLTSPESFVTTKPPRTIQQFINQRKRHFSAGKYYPLRMKIIFSLLHSFNALALFSLLLFPLFGIGILVLKLFVDWQLMKAGTTIFGNTELLKSFVPLEILFVLYNLLIGPLGFIGQFEWKETRS